MSKAYNDMTDEEVKAAVKAICKRCEKFDTDEEANDEVVRLIQEELGYNGPVPFVTSTSTRSGPMIMRMFSVMLRSPSGKTLSV